jgi:hypothetical protein
VNKPKTNAEAFRLVIEIVGTKTELARRLGVVKQLVSRWDEIPPPYLEKVSEVTDLPLDWILPELEAEVTKQLGRPSSLLLPALIRLIYPIQPASPQFKAKKRK